MNDLLMKKMNALITARCIKTVQFYDVDAMNVVWHGNYLRFFEEARSELLNLLGYNYQQMEASGYLWPIVDLQIKYLRPLILLQKFIVEAGLIEYENRLKIDYQIVHHETGEVLTKGSTIQVAVTAIDHELQYVCPPDLVERVLETIK